MKNFDVFNEDCHQHPLVVSLPHSGTYLPAEMQEKLLPDAVIANVDWFLRELYDFLVSLNVSVIQNNVCRYVADPNRATSQRDMSGSYSENVIYQRNTFGHLLYAEPLDKKTQQARLQQFYWPYHQQLAEMLAAKTAKFDKVLLLDLHSFAEYPENPAQKSTADFVLGNTWDLSSNKKVKDYFAAVLAAEGYSISDNYPFNGGFITRHYGEHPQVEALQLEIRYHHYIEDRYYGEEYLTAYQPEPFYQMKQTLEKIFQKLLRDLQALMAD